MLKFDWLIIFLKKLIIIKKISGIHMMIDEY